MEIEVLGVRGSARPHLDFRSAYGYGWGAWMGEVVPKAGNVIYVEIDFPDEIRDCKMAASPIPSSPVFSRDGEELVVACSIEIASRCGITFRTR